MDIVMVKDELNLNFAWQECVSHMSMGTCTVFSIGKGIILAVRGFVGIYMAWCYN